jgi:biopolymer transport protein ExbD
VARQIEGDETVHRARSSPRRPGKNMQPPLTPMIDVTFQLLIFFLLTTQFRAAEGLIPSKLPQGEASTPDPVKLEPIEVVVAYTGIDRENVQYEVNNAFAPFETPEKLYDELMARKQKAPPDDPPAVKVSPGREVPWQYVTEAFNQAVRAGFPEIGFASESTN